jgi:hypothetical protein
VQQIVNAITIKRHELISCLFLRFSQKQFLFAKSNSCKMLLLLHMLFFLASCTNTDSNAIQSEYFSLSSYFETQKIDLLNTKQAVKKVTSFGTELTSEIISKPDWEKEFALFTAQDINKPALKNTFIIDTLNQDSLNLLRYASIDKDAKIQKVEITFLKQEVKQIYILVNKNNYIYSTNQELRYTNGLGYKIIGSQDVLGFWKRSYSVETNFQN